MAFPWCVMLVPDVEGRSKGALLLDAAWPPDRVITLSFLDGDPQVQARVKEVAQQWLDRTGINLSFSWRTDTNDTDIRISFRHAGSWSVLGSHALRYTDPRTATMNFGWLRSDSTDEEVREVVLHEFGHALGLIHEHSHPEAEIPWDRQAVIEELSGPPNNWKLDKIERNVFRGYDRSEVMTTPFDEKSIMLYPVKPEWTIGGYSTRNNTDLSDGDIALVQQVYLGG